MHIHETAMAKKLFGYLGYALQNRIANREAIILKDDSSSTLFHEKLALSYRYTVPCHTKENNIISDHELRIYSHPLVTFC